jgi:hypothetical protein
MGDRSVYGSFNWSFALRARKGLLRRSGFEPDQRFAARASSADFMKSYHRSLAPAEKLSLRALAFRLGSTLSAA